MDKCDEFVKIYNEIHEYMKDIMNIDNHRSFTRLIRETKNSNYIIKNYEDYLLKFSQLRNIIVHENEVVAIPNDFSFELIKNIRDKLLDPPRVFPLFKKKVITYNQEESIIRAIKIMNEKSFSKLPLVDDNNHFTGLLTNNSILKWMGDLINNKGSLVIDDIPAKNLLQYSDKNNIYSFIAKDTKLIEVVKEDEKIHKTGKRMIAFLITDDGTKEKEITGIITNRDMAVIYRELDL